jgi:hypothetical protein
VRGQLVSSWWRRCLVQVLLQAGDVLYLPRGTVHQAQAQDGESSHLTISTYQRWSYGDYLQVGGLEGGEGGEGGRGGGGGWVGCGCLGGGGGAAQRRRPHV